MPPGWGAGEREILFALLAESARPDAAGNRRLLDGLAQLLPRDAAGWIDGRVPPSSPPAERAAGLRLLARLGREGDLSLFVRLARASSREEVLAEELRSALAGLLRRQPEIHGRLWAFLEELPPDLRRHAFEALEDVPHAAALPDLAGWLDRVGDERPVLLRAIALAAEDGEPPHEDEVGASVRDWLEDEVPETRSAAARACGALEDAAACEALLALLEDEHGPVRRAALDGLRAISRQRFRADPERWRSWLATERAWWSQRSRPVLDLLRSASSVQVVAAIGELASHTLDRHRLAAELVVVLQREDARLRELAAIGLEQLASPLAVAPLRLVAADEDEEPSVRAAAERALVRCQRPAR